MTLGVVRRAGLNHLDVVAHLFDLYRMFYGQPSDPSLARAFIRARMERDESVVLLAWRDEQAVGFVQLYPAFSSVSAARTWILNDLLVVPEARRLGVARALLSAAADFARDDGALRLELETDHDNHGAQALYRDMGWTLYLERAIGSGWRPRAEATDLFGRDFREQRWNWDDTRADGSAALSKDVLELTADGSATVLWSRLEFDRGGGDDGTKPRVEKGYSREVLRLRARHRGVAFDDAAIDWLLTRCSRDLSDLSAIFERLDRASLAAQRRITVPFLREVLGTT